MTDESVGLWQTKRVIREVKRTKIKRVAAKSRFPKISNRKRNPYKRAPDPRVEGDWEDLESDLRRDLPASRNPTGKLAPFERPEAVLKRYVYRFVREHLEAGDGAKLEYLLGYLRSAEQRAHRIAFETNPFHWALSAIPIELSELKRPALTKVGRQLLYAHRHDVDPDLLIGFLYQSGDPDEISRKAVIPNKLEDWYLAKLGAEAGN